MAIFATYNSESLFLDASFMNKISFASLGQATAVCSKAPNIVTNTEATFNFGCTLNYNINEVFSTGLLSYDPHGDSISDSLFEMQTVCY